VIAHEPVDGRSAVESLVRATEETVLVGRKELFYLEFVQVEDILVRVGTLE
jgi:hypothetical protein